MKKFLLVLLITFSLDQLSCGQVDIGDLYVRPDMDTGTISIQVIVKNSGDAAVEAELKSAIAPADTLPADFDAKLRAMDL